MLQALDADFWGEETGQRLTGQSYCWVVDPHDGTRDFLLGLQGSSISVALLRDRQPVLGVVCAPISSDRGRDCLAWAEGLPHLLRNGKPHPVNLSHAELSVDGVVWLSAAAARKPHANIKLCSPARFIAAPSVAYRLARAAAGDGVAAVSLTELSAHDVAGGHALLVGAKGILLNQSGLPLDYQDMGLVCVRCFGGAPSACQELATRDWDKALGERSEPQRKPPMPARFPAAGIMQRAMGCMAGTLVGDNLGAQVEFMEAGEIAKRFAVEPLRMRDGGVWNILAGQPTDDGELALALARSLVKKGAYCIETAAQSYIDWLASEPFDVGNTTRQALLGPLLQLGSSTAQACKAHASISSQANGALMRVAPIGIAAHGRPDLAACWARLDAQLTHPHPVCQEANAAFAAAIAVAIQGADRKGMFESALSVLAKSEEGELIRGLLVAAASGERPADYQRQMGWVLIALQNAFYHLMAGDSAVAAITETIMQGGDTDTNACTVGALLGSVGGIASIDWGFVGAVVSCRPHQQAERCRPLNYWPDDIALLSQRLVFAHQCS